MSRAWIIDVLDRELPHMAGAERDQLADKIVDAIPTRVIAAAITESLLATIRVIASDCITVDSVAKDVGANASMHVVEALGGIE